MKFRIIITLFFAVFFLQYINSQELALVKRKGYYGYINKKGEWKIKPKYKKAGNFSDNLAPVFNENKKKWGFVDPKGKLVIGFIFDSVKKFNSGIALVSKNKKWFYIDKTGKSLKRPDTERLYDFNAGVALIKKDKRIGLINTKFEVILEPIYAKILSFKAGYAKVKKGNLWGIIDTEGNEIIKPIYEKLGNSYENEITFAKKGTKWGVINDGKFTINNDIVKIWDFRKGEDLTHAMNRKKKIGFVDKSAKWVIEPQFKKAKAFSCGLAPVMTEKKWGYIDKEGKIVIEENFKDAEVFLENLAPVKFSKHWGFINKQGKLIIRDKYKINTLFSLFSKNDKKGFINGVARVGLGKKWGYLLPNGQVLNNTWYDKAKKFVKIKQK